MLHIVSLAHTIFERNLNVPRNLVLAPGASIVLSSTCPPSATILLSNRLGSLQNKPQLIDAPVSGGTIRAANGDLTIMASGEPAAVEKARGVLQAMTEQGGWESRLSLMPKAENLSGSGGSPDKRLYFIPGGVSFGSSVKVNLDTAGWRSRGGN